MQNTEPLQKQQPSINQWLKQENVWLNVQYHDKLILQLQAKQQRQSKWLAFLVISYLFTLLFIIVFTII